MTEIISLYCVLESPRRSFFVCANYVFLETESDEYRIVVGRIAEIVEVARVA